MWPIKKDKKLLKTRKCCKRKYNNRKTRNIDKGSNIFNYDKY